MVKAAREFTGFAGKRLYTGWDALAVGDRYRRAAEPPRHAQRRHQARLTQRPWLDGVGRQQLFEGFGLAFGVRLGRLARGRCPLGHVPSG
jgi:hypothetical protein